MDEYAGREDRGGLNAGEPDGAVWLYDEPGGISKRKHIRATRNPRMDGIRFRLRGKAEDEGDRCCKGRRGFLAEVVEEEKI